MKRMFLVLTVLLCTTVNVLAQEVHGVESKMVCTGNCNPNGSWDIWDVCSSCPYNYPLFGYEFTNLNSISVSVEVELYHKEKVSSHGYSDTYDYILIGTKSFVLKSGESYVFKKSEDGIDKYENSSYYYVKYKAYKLL